MEHYQPLEIVKYQHGYDPNFSLDAEYQQRLANVLICGMQRSTLAGTCQQLSLSQSYRLKIRKLLTNFLIQIKASRIFPSYNNLI